MQRRSGAQDPIAHDLLQGAMAGPDLILGRSPDHGVAFDQLLRGAPCRRELPRVAIVQRADRRAVGGPAVQGRIKRQQPLHERQRTAGEHHADWSPPRVPAIPVSLDDRRQRRLGQARVLELVDDEHERPLIGLRAKEVQCRIPGAEAQRRRAGQQLRCLGGERRQLHRARLLIGLIADDTLPGEGVPKQECLADASPSPHHDEAGRGITLLPQKRQLLLTIHKRPHHQRPCYYTK